MWFLIGLILLGFIFTIIWITSYNTYQNNNDDGRAEGWMYFGAIFAVVSWIGVCAMLIAVPVTYVGSINTIADLEAFQDGVFETYVTTINATEDKAVVKLDLEKLLISAENIKQSTNISDRIVELRREVEWYSNTLKRLRTKNKIWWMYGFYKKVPDSLLVIKLTNDTFAKQEIE